MSNLSVQLRRQARIVKTLYVMDSYTTTLIKLRDIHADLRLRFLAFKMLANVGHVVAQTIYLQI